MTNGHTHWYVRSCIAPHNFLSVAETIRRQYRSHASCFYKSQTTYLQVVIKVTPDVMLDRLGLLSNFENLDSEVYFPLFSDGKAICIDECAVCAVQCLSNCAQVFE